MHNVRTHWAWEEAGGIKSSHQNTNFGTCADLPQAWWWRRFNGIAQTDSTAGDPGRQNLGPNAMNVFCEGCEKGSFWMTMMTLCSGRWLT